jgi:murein DD-endopeptidase MepM/ murein hydrolase activator NlpD
MRRDGFLVKIVPPGGYDVYRLHLSPRAVWAAVAGLVLVIVLALGTQLWQLQRAAAAVHSLEAEAAQHRAQVGAIDHQADALSAQLRALQRENAEIRRLLGVPAGPKPSPQPSHAAVRVPVPSEIVAVKSRLDRLAQASHATTQDQRHLAGLVNRVLDLRRLARTARNRMLAALPSLNPVDGAVVAGFGYRTNPWPEFHKGLDLAADYGAPVHAAAAGVVASAGWDGGFGIKVDIDHGNGYHTWYAHLSRVAVAVGQTVAKRQTIGAVGATGEATGPHLHYQIVRDGTAIDPAPFLDGVPRRVLASLPDPERVQ